MTARSPSPVEVHSDQLVTAGLACLAALHKGIDETSIDLTAWVCKIRTDLLQAVSRHLPCTEGEAVKIQVTQHWLRAVFWQQCSSRGLISSLTGDAVQFLSPMWIAKDLEVALETFSRSALEVHGEVVVSLDAGSSSSFFFCAFLPKPVLIAILRLWRHSPSKLEVLLNIGLPSVSGLTHSSGQTSLRRRLLLDRRCSPPVLFATRRHSWP